MKGEYEIYCISTEDFNAMKAGTSKSVRTQKVEACNGKSKVDFDESLRSNEKLNIA